MVRDKVKMSANVAALLRERASCHPDRAAVIQYRRGQPRRVTFAELEQKALRLAAVLRARGIGPGSRVLVFVPMSIELYVTLLACLHRGAAAVFVDIWADRSRLDVAVAAAAPDAVIATPKAHFLQLISPALRAVSPWLSPTVSRSSGAPIVVEAEAVTPDTPALVTFTTGSTGNPKGAVRSHALLWAQHRALDRYLRLEETDVDMPTLPMFVLNNLALGVTSVLPDFDPRRPGEIRPDAVYRQLLAEGVTTSSGSPSFYERLGEWCRERGHTLPLRAVFTGGAPVLPPLARLLTEIVQGESHAVYGSTEAEPISGISLREMLRQIDVDRSPQAGLPAGRPVDGVELRLLRPHNGPIRLDERGWETWDVEPGKAGEVAVAGEHVLQGYLGDSTAEQNTKIRDGGRLWHRTGDAARLDEGGRLWLLGRMRDGVERSGTVWWTLPAELQAIRMPGIRRAAYLSVQNRALLCVEPTGGRLSAKDRQALRRALDPVPVDELHSFRRLPRDARHQSRNDLMRLREWLR